MFQQSSSSDLKKPRFYLIKIAFIWSSISKKDKQTYQSHWKAVASNMHTSLKQGNLSVKIIHGWGCVVEVYVQDDHQPLSQKKKKNHKYAFQ